MAGKITGKYKLLGTITKYLKIEKLNEFCDLKLLDTSNAYYDCVCFCGNKTTHRASALVELKDTVSCGCMRGLSRRKDLTKIEFPFCTPLESYSEKRETYTVVIWKCKCVCGKEFECSLGDLMTNKKTISCGCKWRKPNPAGEITYSYWSSIKISAKERDIEFKLSPDDAWNLYLKQDRKCNLSNVPIEFNPDFTKRHSQTASLDRIDSNGIYEIGNVQWVYKEVNFIKLGLPQEKFLFYAHTITDYSYKINKDYTNIEFLKRLVFRNEKNLKGTYFSRVKKNARDRDIEIHITKKDIWHKYCLQGGKCNLSGLDIEYLPQAANFTASVDRIDSNKNYTLDNIQIVHKDINMMKGTLSQSEFIDWMRKISYHARWKYYQGLSQKEGYSECSTPLVFP